MTREEAIRLATGLRTDFKCESETMVDFCNTIIKALEQEPKTGQWFIDERPESDREVVCSNCDQPIFKYHKLDFDYRPKYCPNCGAKMGVEE